MSGPRQDGIDIRHYLRQAWRRKWILLAVVVLIPGRHLPADRAPAEGLPGQHPAQGGAAEHQHLRPDLLLRHQGQPRPTIKTDGVARLAARELVRTCSAGALLGKINTSVEGNQHGGRLPEITARTATPSRPRGSPTPSPPSIAQTRTNDAISKIDQTIATLSKQGGDAATRPRLPAASAAQGDAGEPVRHDAGDRARHAPGPRSPESQRNARIAFVLSLLIAAGLVPLLNALDRRRAGGGRNSPTRRCWARSRTRPSRVMGQAPMSTRPSRRFAPGSPTSTSTAPWAPC